MRFSLLAAILLTCATAFAQPQRTFVSTSGVDNATCLRQAPCRNFNAAITAVAFGGEVIAIDSGGYGPVAVPKAVSISAPPGVYAGITVMSGSGVLITAATGEIILRGLTINSLGGADGVRMDTGVSLQLERCVMSGFSGHGVLLNSGGSRYLISDSQFIDNEIGLQATPVLGSDGVIDRSRFYENTGGIDLADTQTLVVRDSLFFKNTNGVLLHPTMLLSEVALDRCLFTANSSGVWLNPNGGTAVARIGSSTFIRNNNAIQESGSGTTIAKSFGNNQLDANAAGVTFDATILLK